MSSPVGGRGRTGCGPPPLRKRRGRTQKQKGGDQLFARRSSLPNVSGITLFPSSPQGDGLSRCLCTARALASSANTLSGNAAARAKRVSQSPAPLRCDVLVIRVACGKHPSRFSESFRNNFLFRVSYFLDRDCGGRNFRAAQQPRIQNDQAHRGQFDFDGRNSACPLGRLNLRPTSSRLPAQL
jgi:hypothetical protein